MVYYYYSSYWKGALPLTYFRNVSKILALDTHVYLDLEKNNRLFFTAFMNLFLTGVFFGLANLYNMRILLQEDLTSGFSNPFLGIAVYGMLIFASIAQVFLAHAGFSLLLWAISKGVKGYASFFPVYLHTGAALAPLWVGMPFIYLYSNNILNPISLLLGAFGLAWASVTLIRSIMANQTFTFLRASIALVLTVTFIISLRIIWS
jgi:hypothetical protein